MSADTFLKNTTIESMDNRGTHFVMTVVTIGSLIRGFQVQF